MAKMTSGRAEPVDLRTKAILLACAVIAYVSGYWPNRLVLQQGMKALGNPAYEGFAGAFLPHLLLYSTLPALLCALMWVVLSRKRMMMSMPFGNIRDSLSIGVATGIATLVVLLAMVWAIMPEGTIHWIAPQPWKIAGNIFSNFYEEYIFRGFILLALMRVIGFWPAAILSSVMWAGMHTQYPFAFQAFIAFAGTFFAWAGRRARSLWAPYTAHMTLDLIADCLIG